MKLIPVLLLLTTTPAFAQTGQTKSTTHKPAAGTTASKTTASRTTAGKTTAGKSDACGSDSLPALNAKIPKVTGCAKPLYALRYTDTTVGTGAAVTPRKWLTVNYTGYLEDGSVFDTSLGKTPDGKDKEPITFPYGAHQVITGWDTGFEGMNIGGKRRLYIPYQLAYGESGRPPVIPAKATLIFDLELVGISDTPPAPKAPPAAPAGTTPPAGSPAPSSNAPAKTNDLPRPATIPPTGSTPQTTPPSTTDQAKPAPTPTSDPTKPTTVPPKQ